MPGVGLRCANPTYGLHLACLVTGLTCADFRYLLAQVQEGGQPYLSAYQYRPGDTPRLVPVTAGVLLWQHHLALCFDRTSDLEVTDGVTRMGSHTDGVRSCNHAFLNPNAAKTNVGLQDLTPRSVFDPALRLTPRSV
jgi:hypothetical protein